MKRLLFVVGILCVLGLSSCHSQRNGNVLLSRSFPTLCWERFDFIVQDVTIQKPTTYDLVMEVEFDPAYEYDYLMVVFSVFDSYDHALRTKDYKFNFKNRDGSWKSELVNGCYRFTLPINSDLSLNEPGTYRFQLENRMPITPLVGVKDIKIINQK